MSDSKEFGVYRIKPRDGRPGRKLTKREIRDICSTYEDGSSMEETAATHRISRTLVHRLLHEQEVQIRDKGHTERSMIDRWIDRQLSVEGPTIMERRRAGEYIYEIAKTYGVSTKHMREHIMKLRDQLERRMDGTNTREESAPGASRQALG